MGSTHLAPAFEITCFLNAYREKAIIKVFYLLFLWKTVQETLTSSQTLYQYHQARVMPIIKNKPTKVMLIFKISNMVNKKFVRIISPRLSSNPFLLLRGQQGRRSTRPTSYIKYPQEAEIRHQQSGAETKQLFESGLMFKKIRSKLGYAAATVKRNYIKYCKFGLPENAAPNHSARISETRKDIHRIIMKLLLHDIHLTLPKI